VGFYIFVVTGLFGFKYLLLLFSAYTEMVVTARRLTPVGGGAVMDCETNCLIYSL
jgi:hypothetical protein